MSEAEPQKWYQKTFGIILLLIFFFPIGLYLMWRYGKWNKTVKIVVTAALVIIGIGSLFTPKVKVDSIALSIPDVQEEYDINTDIPVDIVITPEDATSKDLEYFTSDESVTFENSEIETGSEEGSYEVYVQADGVQSNVITINVVDIAAREKAEKEAEEKRLAEEQAAKEAEEKAKKEAEEKAAAEAEAQRLAEEKAAKEQAEKEAVAKASTSTSVAAVAAGSESQSSSSSSGSSGSGDGGNFNTYDNAQQQDTSASYVLNTSTMKFHRPSCSSVKKIAPQNYSTSNNSREELISQGYSPCGKCNP